MQAIHTSTNNGKQSVYSYAMRLSASPSYIFFSIHRWNLSNRTVYRSHMPRSNSIFWRKSPTQALPSICARFQLQRYSGQYAVKPVVNMLVLTDRFARDRDPEASQTAQRMFPLQIYRRFRDGRQSIYYQTALPCADRVLSTFRRVQVEDVDLHKTVWYAYIDDIKLQDAVQSQGTNSKKETVWAMARVQILPAATTIQVDHWATNRDPNDLD